MEMTREKLAQEVGRLRKRVKELEYSELEIKRLKVNFDDLLEKYKSVFRDALDVIMIIDGESGKILSINDSASYILGYEAKDLVGKHFSTLIPHEEQVKWKDGVLDNIRIYGGVIESQKFLHADGSECPMDLSANMVPWEDGVAIVATFRGVSEREKAEVVQKKAEEFTRHLEKMEAVGRVAGGIAHDINNYLGAISGFCEYIKMKYSDHKEVFGRIDKIQDIALKAGSLMKQLLSFSLRQPIQIDMIDLNTLIIGFRDVMDSLIGERCVLREELKDGLWMIAADANQIEQLVVNLLINARDAMPEGGKVRIKTDNVIFDEDFIGAHPGAKEGRYVLLSIKDTGIGIPEPLKDKIFEPFFTTKEKGEGTGLGLSMVYGAVKQNGGYIWVESEVGAGSEFSLFFPLFENRKEYKGKMEEGKVKNGLQSKKILLIEDNEDMRDSIRSVLEMMGHSVFIAESGKDAVERYMGRADEFDLVMTDVVMPGMSGKEAVDRIRSMEEEGSRDLKVLFMSGYTDDVILNHGIVGEEVDFLQKPFTVAQLMEKLKKIFEGPLSQ